MRILAEVKRTVRSIVSSALGKLLGTHSVDAPLPISQVESVLILCYDALGDFVLSTPIWRIIRSHSQTIRIGVVGSEKNISLLRHDANVDEVFMLGKQSHPGFGSELMRAKSMKWDVVINLVYNDKTRAAIMTRRIATHAPRVTAVRDRPNDYLKLYSRVALRPPYRPPTPMVEQHLLTLTAALEISAPIDHDLLQPLHIDRATEAAIRSEVQRINALDKTTWVLHFNTEASETFREWGLENALEASKQLLSRYTDLSILWTASPVGAAAVQDFLRVHQVQRAHFLATPTPNHLVAVVRSASLVISPDTSVIHIASAEKKPVVGLYVEANEYLPYQVPNRVLMPEWGKPLRSIGVQDVVNAATALIEERLELGR